MVHSSAKDMIKYWINRMPHTCCALFEKMSDLESGIVLMTIVCVVLPSEIENVRNVKNNTAGSVGGNAAPGRNVLTANNAAAVSGDESIG